MSFSHKYQLVIFHQSLRDSKSPQVSRTLLSILADFNNAVFWMAPNRPLISKSYYYYHCYFYYYYYLFYLDYVLRTSINLMKENGFKLAKERIRRNPAQTFTDAVYADDITLTANTPTLAEYLLLVWNEQQVALDSLWMQRKQNTCALIKEVTSPY